MLACFLEAPKKVAVKDVPIPKLAAGDILVRMEPASCCIRAIRRANIKQGDNILVVGLGPTGLTQIQLLRHATTGKIFGSDIVEARLRLGKRLGADDTINALEEDVQAHIGNITKDGVDLAIVSTGNEKALSQAFSSDRKSTRLNSSHLVISYAVFCLTI